ncbi:hypothetical protein [Corynebacterium vitaeruminis]|uniref:Uncharacterized protein n=1 Tax=Corynebacterium vitaeruminis DSM 20294 TaxID=1224164 RepID=W5Y2H7_9CORY|nr:hypothetical protein [Corynebacterium vitaeruminis]AHI23134.1 hypothetical protein B843_08745 [Corynebacterium vitaeruminis DSM 20294]
MSEAILAQNASAGSYLLVYIMFLVAGLLVGGAWTTYKHDNKVLSIVLGACAVMAAAAGILWAVGIFA